jgi:hypothetical protein
MVNLHYVFLVFGFVFEVLAAIGVPSGRYNLMAAGLACGFAAYQF